MGAVGRIAGALALVLAAGAAAEAPRGPVAERRAGMHRVGEIMRDLRAEILAGRDVVPLADPAQRVADWAERLLTLFPPGSDASDTHAIGTVWSDRPAFTAKARTMGEQARRMANAARAGDRDGFAAAYRATASACGQCHRDFRQR